MKKIITIIIIVGMVVIAIGVAIWFVIQQQSKGQFGEERYEYLIKTKSPKLEGIDIESIIEYEDYYVLGVHFPVTENDKINTVVNNFVQGRITEFKKDAKEFFEGSPPPGGFSSWKYELNIDYEVNRPSKDIVGFKFIIFLYTGGANVNQFIKTYNFNFETGEEFGLNDVFKKDSNYLNLLSELSAKQLVESGRLGDLVAEWMLELGTAPEEKNFERFGLKEDSIIFFFPKYQVAPGAAGEQYVEFQYDELKDILNPEITENPIESEEVGEIKIPEIPKVEIGDSLVAALTFDDGPNPIPTSLILDELKKRGAVATFFVVGNRAQYYPELLRRIVVEGSEIGNHTWSHRSLISLSLEDIKNQINDTQKIVKDFTGVAPTVLRPPYGRINDFVKQNVDMPIILWSVDPEDWKNKESEVITAHIIIETDDGEIVLQHDLYLWSAEAVGPVLDELISQGYKFVTVSQLLGFTDDPVKAIPGEVFRFQ